MLRIDSAKPMPCRLLSDLLIVSPLVSSLCIFSETKRSLRQKKRADTPLITKKMSAPRAYALEEARDSSTWVPTHTS